jgi:hypothetical protein
MQARSADPELERGADALVAGDTHGPRTKTKASYIDPLRRVWWPPSPSGQEEKAGPFLVGVTEKATMGIGAMLARRVELVHAPTLERDTLRCLTNRGNYT